MDLFFCGEWTMVVLWCGARVISDENPELHHQWLRCVCVCDRPRRFVVVVTFPTRTLWVEVLNNYWQLSSFDRLFLSLRNQK
jgi:hypothetical protein